MPAVVDQSCPALQPPSVWSEHNLLFLSQTWQADLMANAAWKIPSSGKARAPRTDGWWAPIQQLAGQCGGPWVVDSGVCKQKSSKPASHPRARPAWRHEWAVGGGWWGGGEEDILVWSEPHGLESWAPCRRGNSRTSDSPTVNFLTIGCQPSLIHWPLAEDGMYRLLMLSVW